MKFSWIVSQIGARQHYGVPRGFFYKDELRLFFTEAWCRFGHRLLRKGPQTARAFAGRWHPDIPNSKVISFNYHTCWDEVTTARKVPNTTEAQHLEYLRIGRWFASAVARDLSRRPLDPQLDVFFGFNTGCLETLQLLNDHKIVSICDQIDPAQVEEDIVIEECKRWPGWQRLPGRIPQEYWQRMRDEWAAASMVLVNSQWSKDALVKQGVPAEKMFIVPVAYEPEKTHVPTRRNMDRPITVLWIGLVNLRKGIQYLIEAAKLLKDNPRIQFVIAGPVLISDQAVASAPPNMQFIGRITRDMTEEWYRKADVFVLPTVSDGFAITQVEAMTQALPVIATPNCGHVVTPGVDGMIVPARDPQALADAIQRLDSDRPLLREMSYRALDKSAYFYLPRQSQLVEEAVINYRAGRPLSETQYRILPEIMPNGSGATTPSLHAVAAIPSPNPST
jgi:glycosyltransferase involved in cell wall biosynthesis